MFFPVTLSITKYSVLSLEISSLYRDDYIQIMFDDYSNKISFEDIESFLKNLKTEDRFENLKNFLNEKSVKFKNDFWVSF